MFRRSCWSPVEMVSWILLGRTSMGCVVVAMMTMVGRPSWIMVMIRSVVLESCTCEQKICCTLLYGLGVATLGASNSAR